MKGIFKRLYSLLVLIFVFISFFAFSEPVNQKMVQEVGITHLKAQKKFWLKKPLLAPEVFLKGQQYSILNIQEIKNSDGRVLAYILNLTPEGFIVISPDTDIRPIIAYSFKGKFPIEEHRNNVLLHMVKWDMENRLNALAKSIVPKVVKQRNNALWEKYQNGAEDLIEELSNANQWPPDRDGWIETHWHQDWPYNHHCPIDPRTGCRSFVGCVAITMAQIINYWKYPLSLSFDESDRYTSKSNLFLPSSYIEIDDDHEELRFPSFNELTENLSQINYNGDIDEIADLCFACGISVHMNYGSEISGCHPSARAYMQKFKFASAKGEFFTYSEKNLQQNIKNAQPVQLGINNSTHIMWGHSVVVDGYKSSGEYHLNMGWGGDGDSWYFLPDIEVYPYYWNIVVSAVLNINPYIWPMYGYNPQHTNRSPYEGPTTKELRWLYQSSERGKEQILENPIVGRDGTIYAIYPGYGYTNDKLLGFDPKTGNKIKEWEFDASKGGLIGVCYPAIGKDGLIYIAGGSWDINDFRVFAINPEDGSKREIYSTAGMPARGSIWSRITVGPDNTIYVALEYGSLYALKPDGTLKWVYNKEVENSQKYNLFTAPSIGMNGLIYLALNDRELNQRKIVAIDSEGREVYSVYLTNRDSVYSNASTPAIAYDGTIYVGWGTKLYALNERLQTKWTYDISPYCVRESPAIGLDGTIYFTGCKEIDSSDYNCLFALNPDGTLKWEKILRGEGGGAGVPIVDGKGIIYLGEYTGDYVIHAFEDKGTYAEELEGWPLTGCKSSQLIIGKGSKMLYVGDSVKDESIEFYAVGEPPVTTYTLTIQPNHWSSGITTPDAGDYSYEEGTVVEIDATPQEGWSFVRWEGDVDDPAEQKVNHVTMNQNKTVIAVFEPFHPVDNGWGTDTAKDWVIGDWELLHAIDVWAENGEIDELPIDDWELLNLIDFWAVGHYYWDEVSQDWKKGYQQ